MAFGNIHWNAKDKKSNIYMFNKDFLANSQTAIELKIRQNSGHRLRHLYTTKP
jgi:hypothetical protein